MENDNNLLAAEDHVVLDTQFTLPSDWDREEFIDELSDAIIAKIPLMDLIKNLPPNIRTPRPILDRNYARPNISDRYEKNLQHDFQRIPCLRDLVSNDEHLKKLDSRYDFANNYLKVVEITNFELYEDAYQEGFPSSRPYRPSYDRDYRNYDYKNTCLNLLNRIEKFMVTLAFKRLPFYLGSKECDFDKNITDIGKEFIYLLSEYEYISTFDHEYLTGCVKIFVEFVRNKMLPQNRYHLSFNQDIDRRSINEVSGLFDTLTSSLHKGRYDPVLIGASRRWFRNQEGAQFRDLKELKKQMQNMELWVERFKNLLSHHKRKDIAVFRFQIEIDRNDKSIRYNEFSIFFTDFISKAKQSNGLTGLLEQINVWKEFDNQVLQCDVALFFDANELAMADEKVDFYFQNMGQLLQEFADSLKDQKQDKDKTYLEDCFIRIRQIPVLSIFSEQEVWLIGQCNIKWKDVYDKLIPYFSMIGSYERVYTDDIKNRASGSRDRTKKLEKKTQDKKSVADEAKKTDSSTES